MLRVAIALLSVAGLIGVGPVCAQTVPPDQSCGGLLCDMGVFGHKVPVVPEGPAPAPVQPKTILATLPPPQAVPVPTAPKTRSKTRLATAAILKGATTRPAARRTTVAAKADPAPKAATAPTAIKVATPWDVGVSEMPRQQPPIAMFQPIYR